MSGFFPAEMLMVTSCSVYLWPSWHCIRQLSSAVPHVASWDELQRNEVLQSNEKKKAQHLSQRPEADREDSTIPAMPLLYVSPSISTSSITPLLGQEYCTMFLSLFWLNFYNPHIIRAANGTDVISKYRSSYFIVCDALLELYLCPFLTHLPSVSDRKWDGYC